MPMVLLGNNWHEISNRNCWENKTNIINMLSAELAKKVVKI